MSLSLSPASSHEHHPRLQSVGMGHGARLGYPEDLQPERAKGMGGGGANAACCRVRWARGGDAGEACAEDLQ